MNAGNRELANAPSIASVRWSATVRPQSERSLLLDVSSCYRAVIAPLSLTADSPKHDLLSINLE